MNLSAQILIYLGAFVSPERYNSQVIPWTDKVGALLRLARTGNETDCNKLLTAIRDKRDGCEKSLEKVAKAKASTEEYIQRKEQYLYRPGWDTPGLLRDINGSKEALKSLQWAEDLNRQSIMGRKREEQAFTQARDFIKLLRLANRNVPDR